jgi:hypothetical protein
MDVIGDWLPLIRRLRDLLIKFQDKICCVFCGTPLKEPYDSKKYQSDECQRIIGNRPFYKCLSLPGRPNYNPTCPWTIRRGSLLSLIKEFYDN